MTLFIRALRAGDDMPKLLTKAEVKERLRGLKGWKSKGSFITKTFEFEHFMDGIGFVNRVAEVAEKMEHHPDIKVVWTSVTLSIQTHSEGGVTSWDVQLAKAIDRLSPV